VIRRQRYRVPPWRFQAISAARHGSLKRGMNCDDLATTEQLGCAWHL